MEGKSLQELLDNRDEYESIHIECDNESSDKIFSDLRALFRKEKVGWVLDGEIAYERMSVAKYLMFFAELANNKKSHQQALEAFGLQKVQKKQIRHCTEGERKRVFFARESFKNPAWYFVQNPILNADNETTEIISDWISEQVKAGTKFFTTTLSLRHALLLPGSIFHLEDEQYIMLENNILSQHDEEVEESIVIQKIAVKVNGQTLLFEPKEIDYVESLNKTNYIFVRNSSFPVTQTMSDLEERLKQFGFFRCHRSYIVNMQRVMEIEKWTKNSYCIRLNDEEKTQIPLSKGRVEELKKIYNL